MRDLGFGAEVDDRARADKGDEINVALRRKAAQVVTADDHAGFHHTTVSGRDAAEVARIREAVNLDDRGC